MRRIWVTVSGGCPVVVFTLAFSWASEPLKDVVNAGIGGNRVLSPTAGPSALARFDRDVLMQPGVTHVVLLGGINDLTRGTATPNPRDSVTADDVIFGYQQLIARAHERGLIIYGATPPRVRFRRSSPSERCRLQGHG